MSCNRSPCIYSASVTRNHSAARVIFLRAMQPCPSMGKLSVAPTAAKIEAELLPRPMCGLVRATCLAVPSDWNALLPGCQASLCYSVSPLKTPPQGCPPWPHMQNWCTTPVILLPIPLTGHIHSMDHHLHHLACLLIFLYYLCLLTRGFAAGELIFAPVFSRIGSKLIHKKYLLNN